MGRSDFRTMQVTTKFLSTSVALWVAAIIVWQIKDLAVEARLSLEGECEPSNASCDPDSGHGPASESWWPDSDSASTAKRTDKATNPALPTAKELSAVSTHLVREAEEVRWVP